MTTPTVVKPSVTIEFECAEDLDEFLLEHQDRFCTNLPDDNSYRIKTVLRGGYGLTPDRPFADLPDFVSPAVAGWKAGDPCAACGSTDTGWNAEQGGLCRGCGRSDSDDD